MALTPSYLQKCTDGIEGEYQKLVTEILVDMAKRIATAKGMTSTTEYLNLKLREMSLHQQFINQALAKVLHTTEEEVEKLMQESTYKSTRDTFTQLEKHGYDTSGLEFASQIEKSTNIAKNELTNLTRTTGQLATSQMMNLYDQAYLQVASGAYSYDQAATNVIKKLAKEGLGEVTYPTGARRSVESAVRVAVRTSVAQNALKCEEDMLDDMDINLVEVSSHLGARPSHAVWQGKIYWRNHPEGNYENFYEATGYGTATGLGGYNCRHQFYPFFGDGDEQTYYHIDETVNQKAYEMEQTQRSLERKLREWDRKDKILTAGGQDNTEAKKWKNYYKQKLNELVKSSGGFLKRDYSAEKAWSNLPQMDVFNEDERKNFNRNAVAHKSVYDTKEYREKVASLSESDKIGNILATEAQQMLKRRSGGLFEDLVYVNEKDGKVSRVIKYPTKEKVVATKKMQEMAKQNPGSIIGLHNHPNSHVPSYSDFTSGKKLDFGLVICHNGVIFKYKILEPLGDASKEFALNFYLDKLEASLYNDEEREKILKNFLAYGIELEVKL